MSARYFDTVIENHVATGCFVSCVCKKGLAFLCLVPYLSVAESMSPANLGTLYDEHSRSLINRVVNKGATSYVNSDKLTFSKEE